MRNSSLIAMVLFLVLGILIIISGILLLNIQFNYESSTDWFGVNETFIVPAGEYLIKEKELDSEMLEVTINVTKGGIKFLALNQSNYLKFKDGQEVQSPFPNPGPVGSANIIFSVTDGKWFFIFDNNHDLTTDKEISSLIRGYEQHILDTNSLKD